jgi:hypothetical protein
MRILFGVALAVSLLVTPPVQGQPAPASAEVPDLSWSVGDTWTWQQPEHNEVNWVVTDVADDRYVVQTTGPNGRRVGSVDRNPPELTEGVRQGTSNPMIKIKFPLSVGEKTTQFTTGTMQGSGQIEVINGGIAGVSWRTDWTVTAIESVSVPAGTFDAYLDEGDQCNLRNNQCGSVRVWFAPQVKHIVKITWVANSYWSHEVRGQSEVLIKYQLH